MTQIDGKGARTGLSKLGPLENKTLVDQVVDAIVEATARGEFLPGDRIVEAEVARALNVSRIPVREALRLLESQSVVVSERYRGMRLMSVDIDGLEKILCVRLALEQLAGAGAIARLKDGTADIAPLVGILERMHAAADAEDSFSVAKLDTDFHRELCRLSGNEVLVRTWEPLSRQLTIVFGLATLRKSLKSIVAEHDDLIAALREGNRARFDRLLEIHILEYTRAVDYEDLVKHLRQIEANRKAV